jgi:hypothetical protein
MECDLFKTSLVSDGLNLSGWTLETAAAITPDGQTIVGTGIGPQNLGEAWIVTIPEPATGLLVMLGVLGLAVSHRRAGVSA